jgi:hypothetical protein
MLVSSQVNNIQIKGSEWEERGTRLNDQRREAKLAWSMNARQ